MECYNSKCNEECDEIKSRFCIRKVSKKEYEYTKLLGIRCECGTKFVAAKEKYSQRNIWFCTNCKNYKEDLYECL